MGSRGRFTSLLLLLASDAISLGGVILCVKSPRQSKEKIRC